MLKKANAYIEIGSVLRFVVAALELEQESIHEHFKCSNTSYYEPETAQ